MPSEYKHDDNAPKAASAITGAPETNSGVVSIINNGLANKDKPTAAGIVNIIKYLNEYLK